LRLKEGGASAVGQFESGRRARGWRVVGEMAEATSRGSSALLNEALLNQYLPASQWDVRGLGRPLSDSGKNLCGQVILPHQLAAIRKVL